MKVCITTMIWKRPKVFRLWAKAVRRVIGEIKNINFTVVVAGSEGNVSKNLVEGYGFKYVEAQNRPLGLKANTRLMSCRQYNPDYVFLCGSDDLISPSIFKYCYPFMIKGIEEIAPMDLYIYDSIRKLLVYSCGYMNKRKGERLAVGRLLHKNVLNRVNWRLWVDSRDKFLDGCSRDILKEKVLTHHYYYMGKQDAMIVDIKTSENISKFCIAKNHSVINNEKLDKHFPEIKQKILSL